MRFTKPFTAVVAAMTLASSISMSAFLAPLAAKAAVSGSLVKASLPAVYYVGQDGKRYVFPHEKTYKTWYADFGTVMTITDAELASMAIGGNVTYRPGAKMVKITTDPKVYAVAKGGVLRWVKTEAAAVALYGSDWNKKIDDVADAFFTNYTIGADINAASDFSVSGEMSAASSINVDKNLGTGAVSGSVSVMLSKENPAGKTIVGGIGLTMLKVDVKNSGSAAVTVDSMTVKRSGPGNSSDFAGVMIYNVFERVNSPRAINSSTQEAVMSALGIVVAPGETVSLEIVGTFNTSLPANNQHALTLTSLRVAGAEATGLPVSGQTFTTTSTNSGVATLTRAGSQPLSKIKAGGMGQKIGEFQLAMNSTEDGYLTIVAPTLAGTISRQNVTNLTLKQAGLTLSQVPAFDRHDRANFYLPNAFYIPKGEARTFEVYADIGATVRAAETAFVYFDDASDVTVMGGTYASGMTTLTQTAYGGSYDGVSCAYGSGNCSTSQVEAGKLTTTFNGPAAKDIARNGKDVELYNFTMAAASNIEVRQTDLVVTVNLNTNCTLVDDLKVVDTATGAIIAGPIDLSNVGGVATTCDTATVNDVISFTETWNMTAGQTRTFKVTADIDNTFPANGTVKVALGNATTLFTANKVRNLDNSTYLAGSSGDFVPATPMVGNTHTIKAPSLTTSASSTPVQQSYIQGTQGVELAGVSLKAGDAGSVKVSSIKFTGFLDNDGDGATSAGQQGCDAGCVNTVAGLVQTLKLWNGTTQIGDTKSPAASTGAGLGGDLTFDNLNLTIPAGQTVTLKVSGNLAGGLSNLSDDVYFNIAAATDVSATDADGSTITPTGTTTGPQMVVSNAGTITMTLAPDDTESEAGNVVGGASNVVLGKFKFTAQNEELKVTKSRITVAAASATAVSSLSLYDGATLVGGPVAVDNLGVADFSSMNFIIAKDASKTLTVKGSLSTVGSSGTASGNDVKVTFDFNDNFEVRGTGAGSSTQITTVGAGDVLGNSKIIRKTKPTVSVVALPSTTLNDGTMILSRFTVSADAAGDVSLKKVSFNSTKSAAIVITVPAIREVGQGSDLAGTPTLTNCGAAQTACVMEISLTSEQTVAAGTSKTFELRATVASTAASTSIQTVIATDSTLVTGELNTLGIQSFNPVVADANYNFIWSDVSAIPHNFTVGATGGDDAGSNDWTNGKYVKTLPSDAQTLTRS